MFKSTNSLGFYCRPSKIGQLLGDNTTEFRIGTCHGSWNSENNIYQIIAIINENPNNGHFQDVIDWFENSCKRDNYKLAFVEVWNEKFKNHLIKKRGFELFPEMNGVIKSFHD